MLPQSTELFIDLKPFIHIYLFICKYIHTQCNTVSNKFPTELFFQFTSGSYHLQSEKLCSRSISLCSRGSDSTVMASVFAVIRTDITWNLPVNNIKTKKRCYHKRIKGSMTGLPASTCLAPGVSGNFRWFQSFSMQAV